MNNSKAVLLSNEIIRKIQMIFGINSVIIGIMGFCVSIGRFDSMDIFLIFFFGIIGILLIYFSIKRKKLTDNFRAYIEVLSNDPTGSIAFLSSATGTPQDVVKRNLKMLIEKKFFVNAYIDDRKNQIIFRSNDNKMSMQSNIQQNVDSENIEYVTVKCESCGGVNKIVKGRESECEYCGSPLK